MGGDFNARIGNTLPEDPNLLAGSCLKSASMVCDNTSNKQGTAILEFMNANGFLLFNGCTPGDSPAGFTFRNALGKSTVDFI